jgi:8-oxo-dGTP pyrophosphatase MutT (NUDIX family)
MGDLRVQRQPLHPIYGVGTSPTINTHFTLLRRGRATYYPVGVLVQFLSRTDRLPSLDAGVSRRRHSSSGSPNDLQCVHVAAVCYRVRGGEAEFLLVRTRNGRWTFPKGRVEQDATHADAAAREAYEEAGVSGSVESLPFSSYRHCKPRTLRSRGQIILVAAHLCKVKQLAAPLEKYRDPTWFNVAKAKRRLQKSRTSEFAAEVISVIDRATERIANPSPPS